MPPFTFIDNDAALRGVMPEIRRLPEVAVDLEMEAHLHHYGVHLALVQLASKEKIWLIDMLAINDPSSLVAFFEDEQVLKVFHDVGFDFHILQELLHCRPRPFFDTKLAATLGGRRTLSLAGLLSEHFGVVKQEEFQRADWMRRPLTEDMLSYAASDVVYLLKLKDILQKELEAKGRLSWFQQECDALEPSTNGIATRTHDDMKGSRGLEDRERGILKALFEERDRLAERLDRPVFFVIPDRILLQLAQDPPTTPEQWQGMRGVHPAVKRNPYPFIKAIRTAPPALKPGQPKKRRLTTQQEEMVAAFLARRDKTAERLGLEGFVVLTREQAERLARGEKDVLRPWQRLELGL